MSGRPPNRRVNANTTAFEGMEFGEGDPPPNIDYYQSVTADYFETMGIEVVEGRPFRAGDAAAAPLVALINETMANVFWPDEDPIGRRVGPAWGSRPMYTIVGIVKDVKQGGVDQPTGTELYFHHPQDPDETGGPDRSMYVVMRTSVDPSSVVGAARAAVARLDATLPLANLATMEDVVWGSVARNRFLTLLLGIFAAIALALAAVGTYGVMSYNVAEQYREIGIRMAIGAQSGDVLRHIIGAGLKSAAIGVVLGIGGALALTRLMGSIVYGVGTRDPATFVAAPVVMVLVAVVASYVPALRATRVDPVDVIRVE
jgi:predicted permease